MIPAPQRESASGELACTPYVCTYDSTEDILPADTRCDRAAVVTCWFSNDTEKQPIVMYGEYLSQGLQHAGR